MGHNVFFLECGVTADNYIQMVRDEFSPSLRVRKILLSSDFQQDGAPTHSAIATRNFLTTPFKVGFGQTTRPALGYFIVYNK